LPIPQLTLQPLLENALIYGIQPRVEGGMVQIKGDYTEGVFQLCVSNPCDALAEQQPSRGTHQALANIEARLTALFGPNASLSVDRRDGRHYANPAIDLAAAIGKCLDLRHPAAHRGRYGTY